MEVYKGKNKNKNPTIHRINMINKYYKIKNDIKQNNKYPIIKIIYEPIIINFD